MYLVGFYSPKKRSGVTETSFEVFKWLNENTDLSIAYVSNQTLQIDTPNNEIVHEFANLPFNKQKKELTRLRQAYDIVISDGSSSLSDNVLKILAIMDRIFILGEDNLQFAESLHELNHFNETFDNKSKKLIPLTNNEKTFILKDERKTKVGFMKKPKDIKEIAQAIYSDYGTYYLKQSHNNKMEQMIKRIQKVELHELKDFVFEEGLSFQKSLLLHQYVFLRLALAQPYDKAIEELFPLIFKQSYDKSLADFRNEFSLVQIQFPNPKPRKSPSTQKGEAE